MDLTTQLSYGDVASMVGAVFTTVSVAFGVYVYARNARRNRVQRTLDYWETVNQKLKSVKSQLLDAYGERISARDAELIRHDEAERRKANKVLNHYERLALGVNLNIYDIETVNRIAGNLLIENHQRFKSYIDVYTQERVLAGKRPMQAWCEFTILVGRLKRMQT